MRRSLFIRIVEDIQKKDSYLVQKRDCTSKICINPLQTAVSAIRQLAYGVPADLLDEYARMGETTSLECLIKLCEAIIGLYEEEYLRRPNEEDVKTLFKENEERGFRGMLGSLDCMHWAWKNCPTGLKGQYQGKGKKATIVLEAVASYDLWIWHASFGLPGSNNDLNVLDVSNLFDWARQSTGPDSKLSVNGHDYKMGYHLVNGIYPPWATLVKAISAPSDDEEKVR